MNELTRRNAIFAAAAGAAAGAAAVVGSIQSRTAQAMGAAAAPPELSLQAARLAAARVGAPVERLDSPILEAHVFLCRSWDRQVYLYVNEETRGFVSVNDEAFAIAAACQAAGRRVAVQVSGYAPAWAGVGRFESVLMAMDARDLPFDPALLV